MVLKGSLDVTFLELSAARAWPALETADCQGWMCRSSRGYTQRANSCLPLDDPGRWADRIAAVETYFESRNQPALFKMPGEPPWKPLDAELEVRGYSLSTPSRVLSKEASAAEVSPDFRVNDRFDEAWWRGYQSSAFLPEIQAPVARALASRVARPVVARVVHNGREAAWAFVSLVDDRGWVFDVVVDPTLRGRGLGRRLMVGLEAEAVRRGAKSLHLQVLTANLAANALYESLGYTPTYLYHYRRQS